MYELYNAFDKEVLKLIYGGGFLSKSEQGNLNKNDKKIGRNVKPIIRK